MKKSILLGIGILLITASAHAGWYAGGNIGYAFLNDSNWTDSTLPGITLEIESEAGIGIGVSGGYDFGMFRGELEFAWQNNDLDSVSVAGSSTPISGDISSRAALLNGYIDFKNKTRLTPFISAGLGFATVEFEGFTIPGSGIPPVSDDDTVFAGQLGAGVGFAINPNFILDLKYRYFVTQDLEFDTSEVEYSSHNIYLELRYSF